MRFLLLLVIGLVCHSFTDAHILRRRSSSTEETRPLRCCLKTLPGVTKAKMDDGHQRECCTHPKTTRDEGKKICNKFGFVLCTHAEKNLAKFTLPECTDHSDPWFADEAAGSSGHTGHTSGSGSFGHTVSASGSGSSGHTDPGSGSGSSGHPSPASASGSGSGSSGHPSPASASGSGSGSSGHPSPASASGSGSGSSGHPSPASASGSGSGSSGHPIPASGSGSGSGHTDPTSGSGSGSSSHTDPASGSGSSGHTDPASGSGSGSGSSGHTDPASGLELGKGHRSWEVVQKILKEKYKGSSWRDIRQNLISADEETQENIRAELHQDLRKKYPGHSIEEIKKKLTDFRDLLDSDIQQHALQHFDDKCPQGKIKAIKNVLAQLKMEPALQGKSWVIGKLKCDKGATTLDECQCDSLTTNQIPTRPIDIDFENEVPTGTQEFLMVIRGENAESPSVPVSCDVILVETDATKTGIAHRYKPTYCPSAEETRIRNLEKTVAMLKQEVKETEGTRRRLLSKRRRKLLQSKGCTS